MHEVPPSRRAAPTIETERLVLRGHREEDCVASAAMWGDPLVTRYFGGLAPTNEGAWRRVLTYAGLWATLGYGYWAVVERATGAFVGEVGLADFKRDIVPSFGGAPEVGWALVSTAWGRGLGTEAVAAALAWSETHLAVPRTVCLITAENAPSIRLAARLGFREYARTTYREAPVHLFERPFARR
jgi:RimJ/RimL family protein N-acetyltransferase